MDSSWQRDCPLEGDSFPEGQKGDSNEVRLKENFVNVGKLASIPESYIEV